MSVVLLDTLRLVREIFAKPMVEAFNVEKFPVDVDKVVPVPDVKDKFIKDVLLE